MLKISHVATNNAFLITFSLFNRTKSAVDFQNVVFQELLQGNFQSISYLHCLIAESSYQVNKFLKFGTFAVGNCTRRLTSQACSRRGQPNKICSGSKHTIAKRLVRQTDVILGILKR